jgi:hypothetical protein
VPCVSTGLTACKRCTENHHTCSRGEVFRRWRVSRAMGITDAEYDTLEAHLNHTTGRRKMGNEPAKSSSSAHPSSSIKLTLPGRPRVVPPRPLNPTNHAVVHASGSGAIPHPPVAACTITHVSTAVQTWDPVTDIGATRTGGNQTEVEEPADDEKPDIQDVYNGEFRDLWVEMRTNLYYCSFLRIYRAAAARMPQSRHRQLLFSPEADREVAGDTGDRGVTSRGNSYVQADDQRYGWEI